MANDNLQVTSGMRVELITGPKPVANPCPECGSESTKNGEEYICTVCGKHFTK